MKWLLGLVTILCLQWVPSSGLAHDIGVSQTELTELEGGQYILSVRTGGAVASMYASPLLPDQCAYPENPRGVQAAEWRTYEFYCEEGLTAEDELQLPWRRDGVVIRAEWQDGSVVERLFNLQAGRIVVPLAELQAGSGSWLKAAKRYTVLGFEHILEGFDHLLFVLALLLLVRGRWMLVKTITAFTVAHSITLALATLGFVNVPSGPVEAVIALSIVFVAVEIMHMRQGRIGLSASQPWIVAFGFGLLHGFGFAGALSEIGLPAAEVPIALLFFNIGVELGQLTFVFAVLAIVWIINSSGIRWPRRAEIIPTYAIGALASFWFIERSAGLF